MCRWRYTTHNGPSEFAQSLSQMTMMISSNNNNNMHIVYTWTNESIVYTRWNDSLLITIFWGKLWFLPFDCPRDQRQLYTSKVPFFRELPSRFWPSTTSDSLVEMKWNRWADFHRLCWLNSKMKSPLLLWHHSAVEALHNNLHRRHHLRWAIHFLL